MKGLRPGKEKVPAVQPCRRGAGWMHSPSTRASGTCRQDSLTQAPSPD